MIKTLNAFTFCKRTVFVTYLFSSFLICYCHQVLILWNDLLLKVTLSVPNKDKNFGQMVLPKVLKEGLCYVRSKSQFFIQLLRLTLGNKLNRNVIPSKLNPKIGKYISFLKCTFWMKDWKWWILLLVIQIYKYYSFQFGLLL